MNKSAIVFGAGGFIGSHMVERLKSEGYWVRGVDLKQPEYSTSSADEFVIGDLSESAFMNRCIHTERASESLEIYQYAADMGGAGFIFTGDHDAEIMRNSATINLNALNAIKTEYVDKGRTAPKIFYSSSACIYPAHNQEDPDNPVCNEDSAYPANPDSEYGWEKLFSERLYFAYQKNFGIPVYVARFHNIFGPYGTWNGGREKAPAAICRKVAEASDGGEIEIWGDGLQTRSFLYIDECIEATRLFVQQDSFHGPMNIGSEEMVTINQLAEIAAKVGNKRIALRHIPGPLGVRGRNSDNRVIQEKLNWNYSMTLEQGISKTYNWIANEIETLKTSSSQSKFS